MQRSVTADEALLTREGAWAVSGGHKENAPSEAAAHGSLVFPLSGLAKAFRCFQMAGLSRCSAAVSLL